MLTPPLFNKKHSGYSLIELIITIVLSSIVMVIFYTVFAKNQQASVYPVFQVKAAELAQAYMEEISLKRFDENSPAGNAARCNSPAIPPLPAPPACTGALGLGSDGEARAFFDDLDDYYGLVETPRDALGNQRSGFGGFEVNVNVSYAGDDFGLPVQSLKKIEVTVTDPLDGQYVFSQYKGNF